MDSIANIFKERAIFEKISSRKVSKDETEFSYYVRLTSELIQRPYMQTFKMVQDWQLHKIKRRYDEAKAAANPQKYWWGKRKMDKAHLQQA